MGSSSMTVQLSLVTMSPWPQSGSFLFCLLFVDSFDVSVFTSAQDFLGNSAYLLFGSPVRWSNYFSHKSCLLDKPPFSSLGEVSPGLA